MIEAQSSRMEENSENNTEVNLPFGKLRSQKKITKLLMGDTSSFMVAVSIVSSVIRSFSGGVDRLRGMAFTLN